MENWPRLVQSVHSPGFMDWEYEKAKAIPWKLSSYVIYYVGKANLQWERNTAVDQRQADTKAFECLLLCSKDPATTNLLEAWLVCEILQYPYNQFIFCLSWMELGFSLPVRKDPQNILSYSTSVRERLPTSCLPVSGSASEGGNWTPFLRRSRYTSFTSLTSTPGKPCDQVWIQEMVPELKQHQKQNTVLKLVTKNERGQLCTLLRKRKLLLNVTDKMYIFRD